MTMTMPYLSLPMILILTMTMTYLSLPMILTMTMTYLSLPISSATRKLSATVHIRFWKYLLKLLKHFFFLDIVTGTGIR